MHYSYENVLLILTVQGEDQHSNKNIEQSPGVLVLRQICGDIQTSGKAPDKYEKDPCRTSAKVQSIMSLLQNAENQVGHDNRNDQEYNLSSNQNRRMGSINLDPSYRPHAHLGDEESILRPKQFSSCAVP